MNISAILVVTTPDRVQATLPLLRAMPGLEVHHLEATTGRIIVTQEADAIEQEVDGLRRIQALPTVVMAEMVQHWFGDDDDLYPPPNSDGSPPSTSSTPLDR